jgi:hypothetical protein
MYHPQKGISIPMPCHEQWQNMAAATNGRHCNACSKTVVDFTVMSDTAIAQYLQQHQHVCGRFRNEQLNKPLKNQTVISKLFSMKKIAAAIISFIMVKNSHAQLPVYDTSVYTWIRSAQTDSVILAQQKQFRDAYGMIAGVVTDEAGNPLKYALVTVGNSSISIGATTNETGSFTVTIPVGMVQQYNILSVLAPGKKNEVRTFHYTSLPAVASVKMEPPAPCACPTTMGIIEKPRCCDVNISMTVDELFVKEKRARKLPRKTRKARKVRTARTSALAL